MWKKSPLVRSYLLLLALWLVAFFIALPSQFVWRLGDMTIDFDKSRLKPTIFGRTFSLDVPLRRGLDIAGGVQLILQADMTEITPEDRLTALQSSVEVVRSRVDAYGVAEPIIQTSVSGEDYRLIVEVPGLTNIDQALSLIGTTAMMDFRLQDASRAAAVRQATIGASLTEQLDSYFSYLDSFVPTSLQGTMLQKATATVDTNTRQPVIALQFTPEGRELFAQITREHTGEVLGIFIDDIPVTTPVINTPIVDGNAIISGSFTTTQAQELAVQLNSGALPVPLTILSQNQVGASLGADSIQRSIFAGLVGLVLVGLFMIFNYGRKGLIADLALLYYAVLIIALYKIFGITLSLPSLAALLISMGMAVDSNILVFSRFQEELRLGKSLDQARELSFGRAMDSIKDANFITLMIALILINPLDFSFLNSSGIIRGFGITLFLGVVVGLFTGIYVTRTLMRVFLRDRLESKP